MHRFCTIYSPPDGNLGTSGAPGYSLSGFFHPIILSNNSPGLIPYNFANAIRAFHFGSRSPYS